MKWILFWRGFWAMLTGSAFGQSSKLDGKVAENARSGRGNSIDYNTIAWDEMIVWGEIIVWSETIVWAETIVRDTVTLVGVNSQIIGWNLLDGMTITWDEF